MIKVVIFDWGGVIAPNPRGGWLSVLAEMLDSTIEDLLPHWREAGYEELSKGTIEDAEFFKRFEVSLGSPLPDDASQIWIDGSAFEPWPEMLTFLETLRIRGIKVALLSNTVKPMSDSAVERGLYKGFEPLIISDSVGLAKPEPPIYQLVLDKLGLLGSECLYVDDLPKNLQPAKDLGMATVLASNDPSQTIVAIQQAII